MVWIPQTEQSYNDTWGLLPKEDGWKEWFAWRPIFACGRWRWITYVQRRRDEARGIRGSYLPEEWPWEYRAGRAHDYPDSDIGRPVHFIMHTCVHCKAKFTMQW